jgi:hypothetical protein
MESPVDRVLSMLNGSTDPSATATLTADRYARSAWPRASALEPHADPGSRAPYAWRATATRARVDARLCLSSTCCDVRMYTCMHLPGDPLSDSRCALDQHEWQVGRGAGRSADRDSSHKRWY